MERGFNAVSYQNVADQIGIRKASVHYHFPTKADLGVAVITRYIAKLQAVTVPVDDLCPSEVIAAFESLLDMFVAVGHSRKHICLGGILGAEFETLPEAMQAAVRRFYAGATTWLKCLLERGRLNGSLEFAGDGGAMAAALIAMLEGGLIVARVTRDPHQFALVLTAARALVLPETEMSG